LAARRREIAQNVDLIALYFKRSVSRIETAVRTSRLKDFPEDRQAQEQQQRESTEDASHGMQSAPASKQLTRLSRMLVQGRIE
jgi:hypothetical protein